jgi:hypothetical protein
MQAASNRMNVRNQNAFLACALIFLVAFGLSAASDSSRLRLSTVSRADLCVTEGAIAELSSHGLSVTVPKVRAYLDARTTPSIEARFKYLGPTGNEARLGSGELRRQFGLKLRAQDACNLVYAMWRIEPESKLVVSVKTNPGQHSSAECGNRGYQNIKPRRRLSSPFSGDFRGPDCTGPPGALHHGCLHRPGDRALCGALGGADFELTTQATGQPAKLGRKAGGAFTAYGGMLVGTNLLLVPKK